jgi:hypothetical protein
MTAARQPLPSSRQGPIVALDGDEAQLPFGGVVEYAPATAIESR